MPWAHLTAQVPVPALVPDLEMQRQELREAEWLPCVVSSYSNNRQGLDSHLFIPRLKTTTACSPEREIARNQLSVSKLRFPVSALRANPPPDLMTILLGQRGFSLGPRKQSFLPTRPSLPGLLHGLILVLNNAGLRLSVAESDGNFTSLVQEGERDTRSSNRMVLISSVGEG